MYLGPLVFKEIFVAKPWGGRAMARVVGKRLPLRVRIGECWEVADHPHGISVVRAGPAAGRTLRELVRGNCPSLLGRSPRKARFPLLIKVLDARERLSVQVHPDDACARRMRLNDTGKTEAWYVLHAGPRGAICGGLKSRKDIPRLPRLAADGTLGERLRVVHPRTGDALLCPAGTVHALGPDVVLLEIQQNSDSTFRLYDWGRKGLNGLPRQLHIEESIRAIGKRALRVSRRKPRALRGMPFPAKRLVSCDKFVIDEWRLSRSVRRVKDEQFEILHVTCGVARLKDSIWPAVRPAKGVTVLIPACVREYAVEPKRALRIVRIAEPE